MKILVLGDVMGPPGRNALKKHLLRIIKDNSKLNTIIVRTFISVNSRFTIAFDIFL